MYRTPYLLLILIVILSFIDQRIGVQIEYPTNNKYIEERNRSDLDSIDPLLRYYIVPREIQFQSAAIRANLPFFLRCKGSKKSLNFTIPDSAIQHLFLNTDGQKKAIRAELRRNKLTSELTGRYTCSEIVNNRLEQTTVHVFIDDGRTVFTRKQYPRISKETGIHFFNVPCQTTNWYSKLSCPTKSNSRSCQPRSCTPQERQSDELKCNMPVCKGQESCIPVSYTPAEPKPEKVLFDPQIGFALFNPTPSNTFKAFTCTSIYTPSQVSRIPFDASEPDFIQIHQPSLTVTKDEVVKLTCEIQYGSRIDRAVPNVFWFEDIYHLNLVTNETEKPMFQTTTQLYSRNTTIVLRGFRPNQTYRFYCVRVSDQGLYTRSVDINCTKEPTLNVEISSSGSDPNEVVAYGSDAIYYISVFSIPRSPLRLELSRDNVPLTNDKRIVLEETNNQNNQFFEYSLTISNVTFEDAAVLKLLIKSSVLEKVVNIKPNISSDPIGQLSFLDQPAVSTAPWRDIDVKNPNQIYPYGIALGTEYRVMCSLRHRSDMKQPLKVFIQYFVCNMIDCLSTLIDRTCETAAKQSSISTVLNRINDFQTNSISVESHRLTNPSTGYQYLCCYQDTALLTLGKALTVVSTSQELFHVEKPEFTLVKGDLLIYRCQAHGLIYRDLRVMFYDGYSIYETRGYDRQWRVQGTNQVRSIEAEVSSVSQMYSKVIQVKTPPLQRSNTGQTLQCIAQAKRADLFSSKNETYVIRVDDPIPLQFKDNTLPTVSMIVKKAGENIILDCSSDARPQPKIVWLKGKLPLINDDSTLQFEGNNQSIIIKRAQPVDTGFYTCELNNGRDLPLKRSFDLRIKGANPYSKIGRLITTVIFIAVLFLVILLGLVIFLIIKYIKMKRAVKHSIFHLQEPVSPEDPSQSALGQLTHMRLPDNFASTQQINTLLNYVNGTETPDASEDFKELGRGQFGVVYQVRLPHVGLVAAKLLPDNIRRAGHRHDKRKKSRDLTTDEDAGLNEHEIQKRKAAEMLIDEIRVMHRAGKHVNIVSLKKVAYPVTKMRFFFMGGPMRDEDSFYLMELCSNGSLESMLKRFLQTSTESSSNQQHSLYHTLTKTTDQGMNLIQACDQCQLTEDDLKLIAYQVACGVDYLNRRQIAHCDIAARNVLVNTRFVMKICDFGLATWTTYKNYREQLAHHDTVQMEKKTNDIATHNLTPELGRAFLDSSDSDERSLLKKASIKADVWSFGIFLWSLFLKCKVRPFYQLSEEVQRTGGRNFFYRLAHEVSAGHVLRYIDYQPDIPANIYALIQLCLVEEIQRPEMTRIRALLCHSKMLSKQAFDYYRMEYDRYQEENSTDETMERFGDDQGVADLPSFDARRVIKTEEDDNQNHPSASSTDGYYTSGTEDYQQQTTKPLLPTDRNDSYL